MENPEPLREHRELEKLAGHFAGAERMHPSYFNADAKRGEATTDAHVALDGFAVVQDYEQQLEDGSHFAGHGVFRYDMPSDTYEMHWFDSTGGPVRIFRGGFADRMLVLTGRASDGWQRLTYDFNLAGGYRFKLETSEDGNTWRVALEGDNLQDRPAGMRAGVQRTSKKAGGARRKAVARKASGRKAGAKKATAKKATARRAPAKKAAGKKTTARKATARKATAKKTTAKKAIAKKTTAKKTTRKTAGKKAAAKRAPARKAVSKKMATRKTATRRPTAKKAATKKAATKKASAKKAPVRKASTKEAAAKKATAKRTPARKAGATARVASVERRRRQGKTSRTLATKKATARGSGSAASRRSVLQKKTKSSVQEVPQMPTLKKTSTRTGWHRTAAKGVRA